MSVFLQMAYDAGYRGDQAMEVAAMLEAREQYVRQEYERRMEEEAEQSLWCDTEQD